MNVSKVKLVTIIIGSEYRNELTDVLPTLGVKGFTFVEVKGRGAHDPRLSFFDGTNLQIEVLANAEVADRVLAYLETNYLPRVALVAHVADVVAMPAGHFDRRSGAETRANRRAEGSSGIGSGRLRPLDLAGCSTLDRMRRSNDR